MKPKTEKKPKYRAWSLIVRINGIELHFQGPRRVKAPKERRRKNLGDDISRSVE